MRTTLREAAYFVGGSMLNRPEDIEIDPVSGSVFISLTNNKPKGDLHGSIMKLTEDSADKTGLTFKTETFLAGSKEAGFSSPDNLAFDLKGNLWFTTDVGGYSLGTAGYEFMPCNSLFLVPRSGEKAGEIIRVATAPHESEFTGPFFHPDGKHLFLSIQHPGEASQSLDALTSNWPDGGDAVPKSGVIVISGESLSNLQAD
jgi:secreted PhoX family phosphatase